MRQYLTGIRLREIPYLDHPHFTTQAVSFGGQWAAASGAVLPTPIRSPALTVSTLRPASFRRPPINRLIPTAFFLPLLMFCRHDESTSQGTGNQPTDRKTKNAYKIARTRDPDARSSPLPQDPKISDDTGHW